MKQTNQTVNRKRWMRTGAVGVVFLAAVLCFGVQSRREKQTVVLETQNSFSKEEDDSQESSERPAKRSNSGAVDGDNEAAENAAPEGQSKENPQTPEPRILYIHVCGEVAAPGVYELPAGSRMYEAVEKAGGMTSEAAQESVNLAQADRGWTAASDSEPGRDSEISGNREGCLRASGSRRRCWEWQRVSFAEIWKQCSID